MVEIVTKGNALLFMGLVVLLSVMWTSLDALGTNADSRQTPWWWCTHKMGSYARLGNPGEFEWLENPCGFRVRSVKKFQQEIFFRERRNQFVFIGDSIGYRNFAFAVNSFLPFTEINGTRRIRHVADRMTISVTLRDDEVRAENITQYTQVTPRDGFASEEIHGFRTSSLSFFKLHYVSLSIPVVIDAIKQADGGVIIIYLGTWDLNWLINARRNVPHLGGPRRHLPTAVLYWTRHIQALMEAIQRALGEIPHPRRPLIIFLEQLTLNCSASRFTGPLNAFKNCKNLAKPVVVPLYRRVLAAMAWHLNIPVVPMAHVWMGNRTYCTLSDGIHLDGECMMTLQQHLWSVYLLFRNLAVEQKLQAGFKKLPDSTSFVDEKRYLLWLWHVNSLGQWQNGRNAFPMAGGNAVLAAIGFLSSLVFVAVRISGRRWRWRCAARDLNISKGVIAGG